MTRIAWASDLHINFATPDAIRRFANQVRRADADILVLCGDISGGYNLRDALTCLELELNVPIRFCLGNHDYYRLTFAEGRRIVKEVVDNSVVLHDDVRALSWLSAGVIEELSDEAVLVGHDGWYDARAGLLRNRVILNDFYEIEDLRPLSARGQVPKPLVLKVREIADEAAAYLDGILPKALARRNHVILATHVPPFPQAAMLIENTDKETADGQTQG